MARSDVQLMLDVKAGDEQSFASAPALQESSGQFSVPNGEEPGAGGGFGAGSFYSRVPGKSRLCAERKVYDVAVPDCDEPGAELAARHAASADGNFAGCAGDCGCGGRRRADVGCGRQASGHRATPGGGSAEGHDTACNRQVAGEAEGGGAAAQVSGIGLRRDREDFGMFGERAEVTVVSGV